MAKSSSEARADAAYKAMQAKVASAKAATKAEGRAGWNKPAK